MFIWIMFLFVAIDCRLFWRNIAFRVARILGLVIGVHNWWSCYLVYNGIYIYILHWAGKCIKTQWKWLPCLLWYILCIDFKDIHSIHIHICNLCKSSLVLIVDLIIIIIMNYICLESPIVCTFCLHLFQAETVAFCILYCIHKYNNILYLYIFIDKQYTSSIIIVMKI